MNVIEMLEKGTAPWQTPWEPGALQLPHNPTTDRPYRGGNALHLMAVGARKGNATYPVDEAAVRHGAGVESGQHPREAYARYGELETVPARTLRLHLKYGPNGERLITRIDRVSKPGRRTLMLRFWQHG